MEGNLCLLISLDLSSNIQLSLTSNKYLCGFNIYSYSSQNLSSTREQHDEMIQFQLAIADSISSDPASISNISSPRENQDAGDESKDQRRNIP